MFIVYLVTKKSKIELNLLKTSKTNGNTNAVRLVGWWVGWVLRYINLCRLFNAKSVFIETVSFISYFQFKISTQFNRQRHFYFKLFSLFKQM